MDTARKLVNFSRWFTRHPNRMVALFLSITLMSWGLTWYSIASQVGKPFPGFFTSPEHVVSSFTPPEFSGWQAGLRPWDMIIAVNGQSWREMPHLVQEAGVGKVLNYTIDRGGSRIEIAVPTMQFTPEILFDFLPSYFISSLIFIFVGIFVYLRNPAPALNRYLLFYLMLWSLGDSIVWECFLSQVKWLAYLLIPYAVIAPIAGWVFFWRFLYDKSQSQFVRRWPLMRVFTILAVVTIAVMTGMRLLADVSDSTELWRSVVFMDGWPYFIVFGLGSIVLKSSPLLIILTRKGDRLTHQQAAVMLAGLLLGLSGWYLFLWAPASIYVRPIAQLQWGGLISTLYPLSIGYAILRYRLLDIRVVIRKGLVYSLLTAALTAAFVLLSLLSGYLFQFITGKQSLVEMIVPALMVAFLFQPVRSRIQIFVDRAFFRKEYEVRQTLTQFSHELNTLRRRHEVIQLVHSTIIDTLGTRNAAVWLPSGQYYLPTPAIYGSENEIAYNSLLVTHLEDERRAFYPLLDNQSGAAAGLRRIGGVLAVPLCSGEKLAGFLTLGERASGIPYSQEDLDLLSTLANSAALALENAHLYEERMEIMREQLFQAVDIQEEERRRIARELHDGVGPSLASLNIRLQTVRKLLEREENPAAHEVAELAEQTQGNIHDIRRLVYDLGPAALDELGLVPAVREYILRYQKDHGIAVTLDLPNMLSRLPSQLETALFRMIQEGLANVARHAHTQHVEVQLEQISTEILLRIQDNGEGFDPKIPLPGNHLGLWSMQKRVDQFGGCFILESAPGHGTKINIRIPLVNVSREGNLSNG
jgi:signal transduction histidine kinase